MNFTLINLGLPLFNGWNVLPSPEAYQSQLTQTLTLIQTIT